MHSGIQHHQNGQIRIADVPRAPRNMGNLVVATLEALCARVCVCVCVCECTHTYKRKRTEPKVGTTSSSLCLSAATQVSVFGLSSGILHVHTCMLCSLAQSSHRTIVARSKRSNQTNLTGALPSVYIHKTVKATWLILPVVVCLSRRLSHACKVQAPITRAKPRMAH